MKAAGYCRVSTEEQATEGLSLDAQLDRITAYCQSKGWDLVETYTDPGFSGKTLRRPAMQRALADAQVGRFDVLVVWRLDRLSRRQRDVLYVIEDALGPAGLVSCTESFDTTTPAGRAMLGMLAVFAQLERESIVERTIMGKQKAVESGRHQGKPPYGYTGSDHQLVPVEPQATFVRELFRRFLEGEKLAQLTEWAAHSGCAPRQAHTWSPTALRRILANPTYAGRHFYQGNVYDSDTEPLVSEEEWQSVQRLLQERAIRHTEAVRNKSYLLSGLSAKCALCGSTIRGSRTRRAHGYSYYYLCVGRSRGSGCPLPMMPRDMVESQIREALARYSHDPGLVQQALDEAEVGWESRERQRQKDLATVRRQITETDHRLARWYDAFEAGAIEAGDLAQRTTQLRDQKATLEARAVELAAPIQRDTRLADTLAVLARAPVAGMSTSALRDVLRSGSVRFVVGPESIEMRLPGTQ